MKKYYLLIVLLMSACFVRGQVTHEDFEDGGKLAWTGVNGSFEATANPHIDATNPSATVGSYTKETGFAYAFARAELPAPFDFSKNPVFSLQVYATNPTAVMLKLEGSPTGGDAREIRQEIPVANEWVTLSFDFSEIADVTDHTRMILFFDPGVAESSDTYLFDNLTATAPPLIKPLDDFEGGGLFTWTGTNGTYEIMANPQSDDNNSSANVGAFTKNSGAAYAFMVTELTAPFDFSKTPVFKLQVYATTLTAVMFKLEGSPTANPIEVRRDIPVANEWVTLSFDLSEVSDVTDYAKMILFFDPGVAESSDTYLIDNLVTSPNFLEDFEDGGKLSWEASNGTYNGIVTNPDMAGGNKSPNAGSYTKGPEAYSLFLTVPGTAFDLSRNNQFKIQVYSDVATSLLVKLEGDGETPIEATQAITETGKWIELTYDFSRAASATGYTKLILFFDPGQTSTDTYLFDNIRLEQSPSLNGMLEDFESGGSLTWQSVDGTYNGIVANPAAGGANESANVGSFTKAPGISSGPLLAALPAPLNLGSATLLNLKVYAANATAVKVRLEGSASAPPFELQQVIPRANEWEKLSFDLSSVSDVGDYTRIKLIFNPEIDASNDVYYFDEVELIADPCAGVQADINIVDNFECQRNAEIFTGISALRLVDNPDTEGINSSATVGSYTDPLDEWSALVYAYDSMPDLGKVSQLKVKVWAPKTGNLLFKLEGGQDAPYEVSQQVTETEQWVEYTVDFASQAGMDHKRLAMFFNAGVTAEEGDVYYVDDIQFTPAPLAPGLIEDFENGGRLTWGGTNGSFDIVANPQVDGNNSSANVGTFTKSVGPTYAFSLANLPSPPDLSQNTTFRMQVYTTTPTAVLFKLEGSATGFHEVQAPITVAEEWTELSFDFSGVAGINDFTKVVIFFDPGEAEGDGTYFFDNIRLGGGSGVVTGSKENVAAPLLLYPNPAGHRLTLQVPEGESFHRASISDMAGRVVFSQRMTQDASQVSFEIGQLNKGVYILLLENSKGIIRSKFIKK